jgi:hypothetical protein
VITAFAFGQSIAFAAAMFKGEGFRLAVLKGRWVAISATVAFYAMYFVRLHYCHQGITEIDSQTTPPQLSGPGSHWGHVIWTTQYVIIGFSLLTTIAGFRLPTFPKDTQPVRSFSGILDPAPVKPGEQTHLPH